MPFDRGPDHALSLPGEIVGIVERTGESTGRSTWLIAVPGGGLVNVELDALPDARLGDRVRLGVCASLVSVDLETDDLRGGH